MTKLANGTPVTFNLDGEEIPCKIVGVVSDLPHGYVYILQTLSKQPLNDFYAYSCFAAHSSQILVKPSEVTV